MTLTNDPINGIRRKLIPSSFCRISDKWETTVECTSAAQIGTVVDGLALRRDIIGEEDRGRRGSPEAEG
jgi:hypothetical protein